MQLQNSVMEKIQPVSNVSEYINAVQIIEKNWNDSDSFLVFRGEAEEYDTPCIPTIYRDYSLKQIDNYEINMFCAMRQNNISNNDDYLHNAIDAQHDGFPSRLLDVTYNCLIALYFATTPYYVHAEDSLDGKDGIVYLFKYNEALSPEAPNTKEIYNAAIEGNKNILNSSFFSYNHQLIDHCKQNKRIIAQQGAFILFTGDIPEPIPFHQICGIRIVKGAKAQIRKELLTLFGIYTGSVYPEVELMKDEIKRKCLRMNTKGLELWRNTEATLEVFRKEYDYFVDSLDYCIANNIDTGELSRIIEKNIVLQNNRFMAYVQRLRGEEINESVVRSVDREENEKQNDDTMEPLGHKNNSNEGKGQNAKISMRAEQKYAKLLKQFIEESPIDLGINIISPKREVDAK